jgi:drug/metabolite transporter (DMT)-like permease
MPTPDELLLIGSTGVIAAFASWCLTHAYRIAAANVVAPFEYTSITWATVAGFFLWGEVPVVSTIIGVLMIVGAGLYVLRATLKG